MCGGTAFSVARLRRRDGLSPRVRGNRRPWSPILRRQRSIPACAGEPILPQPAGRVMRVYPRVCGGTHSLMRYTLPLAGLSPRVRGNRPRLWR